MSCHPPHTEPIAHLLSSNHTQGQPTWQHFGTWPIDFMPQCEIGQTTRIDWYSSTFKFQVDIANCKLQIANWTYELDQRYTSHAVSCTHTVQFLFETSSQFLIKRAMIALPSNQKVIWFEYSTLAQTIKRCVLCCQLQNLHVLVNQQSSEVSMSFLKMKFIGTFGGSMEVWHFNFCIKNKVIVVVPCQQVTVGKGLLPGQLFLLNSYTNLILQGSTMVELVRHLQVIHQKHLMLVLLCVCGSQCFQYW